MARTKTKGQKKAQAAQAVEGEAAQEDIASKPAKKPRTAKQPAGADAAAQIADEQPANQPAGASKQSKQRAKDEIDEIFGKTKKGGDAAAADAEEDVPQVDPAELQKLAEEVQDARKKAQAKKPKVEGSKDDIFGEQAGKPRKRTEEGYTVYGEDELGLNKKGGDTPLCPFDCDCCY